MLIYRFEEFMLIYGFEELSLSLVLLSYYYNSLIQIIINLCRINVFHKNKTNN